jgi:hypothetical protein
MSENDMTFGEIAKVTLYIAWRFLFQFVVSLLSLICIFSP